jgi:DNA-binding MarR family transcriptional regulator
VSRKGQIKYVRAQVYARTQHSGSKEFLFVVARYTPQMATARVRKRLTQGSSAVIGFEALVAVLHIQAQVVRPIDDALERAHRTNITGYEVLARLQQMPGGASVRFLSDQVVVSPSRVSRVTEDFVSRGLLERTASPHDGRLSLVALSPKGQQELGRMHATFEHALNEHFLARLTATQIRVLTDIGSRLGAPHC